MRRKIGITLVSLGLAMVFFAASLLLYNNYQNKRAMEQSDEVVSSLMTMNENNNSSEIDPFDTEMKVVEIDGYGYIGYISIPDLELNLPVMSECDYDRLRVAPCRYYGSTKTDNLVIAAHNFKSHFGYIGRLKQNAKLTFTDMENKKQAYTVTSVEILQPYDTDKVKDTGDDLIMYTCTYGGRTRVVVRCTKM